jgi:hypothetical protein
VEENSAASYYTEKEKVYHSKSPIDYILALDARGEHGQEAYPYTYRPVNTQVL